MDGERRYEVIDAECVGCNLCSHVCPVDHCITMHPAETNLPFATWKEHPNNPLRVGVGAGADPLVTKALA